MATLKPTFCRVCEPSCGLLAEVENDTLIRLRPDRDHPITKGFACLKGINYQGIHQLPGNNVNILLPTGPGSFEKLSNQAFMTGILVTVSATMTCA